MARLDELIGQITDPILQSDLRIAVSRLRRNRNFGLVFEEHVPENAFLPGHPIRTGMTVQLRRDTAGAVFTVREIKRGVALMADAEGAVTKAPVGHLAAVRQFGDPIYPFLESLGRVANGGATRADHVVISGENFHALQLMQYLHKDQVDCIYIDPPYNTGARDWKYNNRYVDDSDVWRHSKWLSMMEKRLKLAARLLKPDGVLIVTIDEHEVHHLGMLLEDMFPQARTQMVTVVINSAGVQQSGFSRVEEFVLFTFFGNSGAAFLDDDLLSNDKAAQRRKDRVWDYLLRSGTNARSIDRLNMCYPLLLDGKAKRVTGTGPSLEERMHAGEFRDKDEAGSWAPRASDDRFGRHVVWPIKKDGSLGNWQVGRNTCARLAREGLLRLGKYDAERGAATVMYVSSGYRAKIESGEIRVIGREEADGSVIVEQEVTRLRPKTVWNRPSHNAGTHGSGLLKTMLGDKRFDYPKSVYAVLDTLKAVVGNKPDAVVLDFFAGSATTLHATCLLNAEDDGARRIIMVTNNEVGEKAHLHLLRDGHQPGDMAYEAAGIFENVARPRVEAAVTGVGSNGAPLEGTYLDGRPLSEGFPENVSFFRLQYCDPDDLQLGSQFNSIHSTLWMAAGAVGALRKRVNSRGYYIPRSSPYAILFGPNRSAAFLRELAKRDDVRFVWIVTDSPEVFAELRAQLPTGVRASMLYRDFLKNFEINSGRVV